MNSFFRRRWTKRLVDVLSRSRAGLPRKQRRERTRLTLEQLEDRIVPNAVNWIGGSGNWNDATHWDAGHVPTASDDASINVSGVQVTLNGSQSVKSLSLSSATLWIQGANVAGNAALTATNGITNDGTIQMESVNSNWTETLAAGSGSTLTNASDGVIQVNAGTGGGRIITGNFTNQGAVNVAANIVLQVNVGGGAATFDNQGTVTVDANGRMDISHTYNADGGTISGPGYVDNGTLLVSADLTTTILVGGASVLGTDNLRHVTVYVQGNSAYGNASLTLASGVVNHGTILLQSVTTNWSETLSGAGGLTNAADGVINVNPGTGGGRTIGLSGANDVNSGQINLNGVTVTEASATFTNAVGGTLASTGTSAFNAVSFTNNGTINVPSGTLSLTGTFTNFDSGTSTLTGGTYLVTGTFKFPNADIRTNAATIVLHGSASTILNSSSGTDALANFATNNGSFTIENNRNFTTKGDFTNNGTLTIAPGIFTVHDNYSQGAGGILNVALNGTSPGSGYGQLKVNGSATLDPNASLTTQLGFVSTNGDTFTVLSAGGGVNGTFIGLPDGGTFVLSGERFRANYPGTGVVLTHFANVATHLNIVAPATATAGAPFDVTVQALDANNQLDTGYTGTVHFSSADPYGAGLPSDYTFTSDDAGAHTFTAGATLYTAGTRDVTAADAGGGISGSVNVTVTPAVADHLVFLQQPSNTVAGQTISPAVVVEIVDAFGNVETGDSTDTVTLALGNNPGGDTLGGTLTQTVVNGVATFSDLSLTKAASGYTLVATSGGLAALTSNGFAITPAAVDHLVFLQQPSDTTAGQTISPAVMVAVVDAFGNVETGDNSDMVTLSIGNNPGGGTLTGTLMVTVVNGVATFSDLSIDTAAMGYTLRAHVDGLSDFDSNTFNIL